MPDFYNIKPCTAVSITPAERTGDTYDLAAVLPVVGMSGFFAKKVVGKKTKLTEHMVVQLLEQDAFSETFVPRSKVLSYLRRLKTVEEEKQNNAALEADKLYAGDALDLIGHLADDSLQCVVTSTP